MNFSIQLILIDGKTKEEWGTFKHNDDKTKDDFHRNIKPKIMKNIENKLIRRYGHNCNIEIIDGEIFIVSQKISDVDGKRNTLKTKANLKTEDFFEKLPKLTFNTIFKELHFAKSFLIFFDKSIENRLLIHLEINV